MLNLKPPAHAMPYPRPLRAMGYLAFLDSGIILRQFQPVGRKSTHPGPFNTNVNSDDIQEAEKNGFFY